MVWGAFGTTAVLGYMSWTTISSQQSMYSAESYLEVLDAEVAPAYAALPKGYQCMQDNAAIYTAKKVKEWFRAHGVDNITDWPPYSPDLNPIEHIWWELKLVVFEMFPNNSKDRSQSECPRQLLESALQAAWDTIDKESFDILHQSMPHRIEACIAADRWHTKY